MLFSISVEGKHEMITSESTILVVVSNNIPDCMEQNELTMLLPVTGRTGGKTNKTVVRIA